MLTVSRSDQPDNELKLKIIKIMKDMLIQCHEYFKLNEEASSVSLRDVARFNKLYKWFKKSL